MRLTIIGGSREAEVLRSRVPSAVLADPDTLPKDFNADAVIDASHPCERATPAQVLERAGDTPVLRLRRAAWVTDADDRWVDAEDAATARAALDPSWARVFLCLGEADRLPFVDDTARWYLVRTRAIGAAHPPKFEVTDKCGPFTVQDETALMAEHQIDVLVTRNAGGQGAIPKVLAARELGLPVVMLARPEALTPEVATIEEALSWLERFGETESR